ncbi:hypothetical protein ACP26L_25805 [Paenibacillus sp. S-38]|uniref:hypothetical protein n=1 Tax=Paenibacillus sp. S-38 TaxID=3416710 RepID=UPI003CEAF245
MPDSIIYDFYECQECCLGYAIEAGEIEEPACPSCQETNARYVITREIKMSEGVASK